jgi:predicted polyphosphate/ATP-dependent NAD kinase
VQPLVGIVANPASGRDVRRLVAQASVFPAAEKSAMVQRVLSALAAVGVERVLVSTDLGGISAGVLRALQRRNGSSTWPHVEFLELALTESAADTTAAIDAMTASGVAAIVVLGGDGTNRVVAAACRDTPIVPLSTGTNNVFPELREATVAGLAAGLVATGVVDAAEACQANKVLEVRAGERTELALVDVCSTTQTAVGSRAVWQAESLRALYVTFAAPDAIGLSSIAGLMQPVSRSDPNGLALRLAPADRARWVVRAPIAPGLVTAVGVDEVVPLAPGEVHALDRSGVISVDGEREIEPGTKPISVQLRLDGPRTVDVARTLGLAAERGLLRHPPTVRTSSTQGEEHTWRPS